MRGEYFSASIDTVKEVELPPRARRIRRISFINPDLDGTTSACAENTGHDYSEYRVLGNYLRVRGEYFAEEAATPGCQELPPRARRIP